MRTIPAALGATLLVIASVMAQSPSVETGTPPPKVETRFAPGGSIYMDLSAGGYVIEGTPDPGIRIRWTTRDASDAGSVRATADVKGTHARITIAGPKCPSVRMFPCRSALVTWCSVGSWATRTCRRGRAKST